MPDIDLASLDWTSWPGLALAVILALVGSIVVVALLALLYRTIGRRRRWPRRLIGKVRRPLRVLIVFGAVWAAIRATLPERDWLPGINHAFLILMVFSGAWLAIGVLDLVLGVALARYRTDVPDNRVARRVQTQLQLVRRLVVAVIVVLAAGGILLTFPEVQALGASVLASAGVVSIVAGLAAQSTLANVFAGIQLAFSDAIRVDDVVIAEGEWGRIEEITLTYVVVHLWDDRRLVIPSTYFTTTPFQNWTRSSSELLGAVELDVDWLVSPAEMRARLAEILEHTDAWDGRTSVLQVTDAVGGMVRVRILVSAADAPRLFDLRCFVREELVEWLAERARDGLPRQRVQLVDGPPPPPRRPTRAHPATDQVGLFTGTRESEERASMFTTAIPIQRDAPPNDPRD